MKNIISRILVLIMTVSMLCSCADVTVNEITKQTAIENAKKMLSEKSIETIINFDNPEIEEVVFYEKPSIYYFKEIDIKGRAIYKVTFKTTMDELLGPEVFYVDKSNGDVIGAGYRE